LKNIALIGYTGFVGGHLKNHFDITHFYNSSNISQIKNKKFDLILCAGAPGQKWLANLKPENDKKSIKKLTEALSSTQAKEFILISTVDVYGCPNGVNEKDLPAPTNAYGNHRYELELFTTRTFKNHHIIRLPGLFGPNLKKNLIFDLLNSTPIDEINPLSSYQWYPIVNLGHDIKKTISSKIKIINFATEPILNKDLLKTCFNKELQNSKANYSVNYNFHTIYAELFNYQKNYIYKNSDIIFYLKEFINSQKEEFK